MRMVFLDESGTGNPEREPWFVLAGVIIHADKQWKSVETYLARMATEHSPIPVADLPHNFALHATELYSGGKIFTREAIQKEKRWEVLDKLVGLPTRFDLPVVAMVADRSNFPDIFSAYRYCFMEISAQVEAYMRRLPDQDEVASIVAEDIANVHWWVDSMHRFQQKHMDISGLHADERDRLRLTKVIGRPHFENKSMYSPLQIADACAWAIRRQIAKLPNATRFFEPIVPLIIDCRHPIPGAYEYVGPRY